MKGSDLGREDIRELPFSHKLSAGVERDMGCSALAKFRLLTRTKHPHLKESID
jgi:hypothetical protein